MTLTIIDPEQGDMEVDMETLVDIMRESFNVGIAATAEIVALGSRRNTDKLVKLVINRTWNREIWIEQFIRHVTYAARQHQEKRKVP